jgi:hypothetical protein
MNETIVITDLDKIYQFRLLAIEAGLRLSSIGIKHSRGIDVKAAHYELLKADIKPKRTHKALYEQFKAWRATKRPKQ